MYVEMIETTFGCQRGHEVSMYWQGTVHDLPESLAVRFLREKKAKTITEAEAVAIQNTVAALTEKLEAENAYSQRVVDFLRHAFPITESRGE